MKRFNFYTLLFAVMFVVSCKNDDLTEVIYPYSNITSYSVSGQVGSATIDKVQKKVNVQVAFGTDLRRVVPAIAVSSNAHITPASGEEVNFQSGGSKVNYLVTSQSGTSSEWTVEVTMLEGTDAIRLELIPNTGGWENAFTVYHDLSYNNFLTRYSGWNGGDGCVSLLLPDGSNLWSFQDSFFGKVDNTRNRTNNTFARNAGFIQKNQSLDSYVQLNPGVDENTDTWVRYPGANANDDDRWYWGGPAQVVGSEVQMLMGQIVPAVFAGTHVSTDVAVFNLDMSFKELIRDKYIGELPWDASIYKADDGYTYMYASENTGAFCGTRTYVARVAAHDLRGTWEYNTTGGWVTTVPSDHSQLVAVLAEDATQPNVFKDGDKYYMVSQANCFGLAINIWESNSPAGPFANKRKLYTIPDKYTQSSTTIPGGYITYNAVVHRQLSKEGELVISYNINPTDFWQNFNAPGSADHYRPYFVRVYNWK